MSSKDLKKYKAVLRVRLSSADAHYGGGLVSGGKILEFFGDAATELLIYYDGDEGLFRAYQEVEFLSPVRGGDFLEITAQLTRVGTTSRDITFEAHKIIEGPADPTHPSQAHALKKAILVARAKGTCVVQKPNS